MANISDIAKNLIDQAIGDLHTAAPAIIETYDPERMVCSIILLYTHKGEQIAPIIEVPVSFMKAGPFIIRPPYKKGDIVLVVFSEKALDYVLNLAPQDPQSKNNHRIDDAIVVQGLRIDSQSKLPALFKEDLLIKNVQAGDYIVMKKDGGIEISSSKDLILKAKGSIQTMNGV